MNTGVIIKSAKPAISDMVEKLLKNTNSQEDTPVKALLGIKNQKLTIFSKIEGECAEAIIVEKLGKKMEYTIGMIFIGANGAGQFIKVVTSRLNVEKISTSLNRLNNNNRCVFTRKVIQKNEKAVIICLRLAKFDDATEMVNMANKILGTVASC
ncbi:MAG: hypothetical protein OEX08_00510 [Candidatus Nomurabacteria bacterium]|nr:hypothetical protein [Candidatus Nomurabacteria bacterium]